MASIRVGSTLSRSLFRGSRIAALPMLSARAPIAIIAPRRQFASANGSLQNAVSTPDNVQQSVAQSQEILDRNARSLLLYAVSKKATMQQIEALFKDAGFDVVNVHMRVDRFTLVSGFYATVELATPQQVSKAVDSLKDATLVGREVVVSGMRSEGFDMGQVDDLTPIHVMDMQNQHQELSQALKPWYEKRRVAFKVQLPAWGSLDADTKTRKQSNHEAIVRNVSKYGIESVSNIAFYHHPKSINPKYMCQVDFATTEGAEQAIRELDGAEVEGRKVQASLYRMAPWYAHRIGEWSPQLLKEMQQKAAVVPKEVKPWVPKELRDHRPRKK